MLTENRIFLFKHQVAYILLVSLISIILGGCSTATVAKEVWGRAEAKEVDVNSKIPGRVLTLMVKEGDHVTKGQILARIDSRDIAAKANEAQAAIKAVAAQVSQASTATSLQSQTAEATVDAAQAQLSKAASDLTLAETDYKRFKKLVESGSVSRQLYDTYNARYEAAQAGYALAETNVTKAQAGLLQVSMSKDTEETALRRMQQSQAALQFVEVALDETEIKAPFDGLITAKYVEEGAMVSIGMPIVAIQDSVDNWINVKVKETELDKYQVGQTVQLQGRDSAVKVQGTITDISKKAEFATYRSTNERDDNDIITFNVKIQVNSDILRPGMRFKLIDGGK
ncbi:HlyD family secretion protein [Pelosinus propionicus]|uniref:HlyD family secretion protein n=1 Tax=Pelosinus propionicus DSM 13327 TaxID=1123291 RepID=A0A1I4JTE6_9FIRM|nr:HlyD family efflux transporter periplasmic adaptor subunit [Pelosinus propionicus]SFL69858.1 HlyD family secretion protein [Pelosinus propionicus DSM 13327]